ncbi:MAG: hypothetical protein ACO1QB_13055 [Verrucomicrobiales bacterium]
MTASKDQTSLTFHRLLRACRIAEQRFHKAAEKVTDMGTKRLLTLYSQQRTRFALELKQEFANVVDKPAMDAQSDEDVELPGSNQAVLQLCAESDQKSLEEYERALREPIPRKAHFLIASQYALMQQVYSRISNLSATPKNDKQPTHLKLERSFV